MDYIHEVVAPQVTAESLAPIFRDIILKTLQCLLLKLISIIFHFVLCLNLFHLQTSPKSEEKETVVWQSTQELRDGSVIMFIGYTSGIQCWLLPPTGIAYEIFSHRRGLK